MSSYPPPPDNEQAPLPDIKPDLEQAPPAKSGPNSPVVARRSAPGTHLTGSQISDDDRPPDDDWHPYRPTPQPAPVLPQLEQPGPAPQVPPPPTPPWAAPPTPPAHDGPPPFPPQPPPFGAPLPPAFGAPQPPPYGTPPSGAPQPPPYGAPVPGNDQLSPPAFAPPLSGPQPPPPAYAPPLPGPQPPPPSGPGGTRPSPYDPRFGQPPPPGGDPGEPAEAARPAPPPRRRKRRLIELGVLLIIVPAVIGVRWYDDSNHAATQKPAERVTIVPRGAWGKFPHTQWRLLGRQNSTTPPSGSSPGQGPPPGSAQLNLLLDVKVLDATGTKELTTMSYEIRDREGHVWAAAGLIQNQSIDEEKPAPGSTQRVKVIATVPQSKLNSVVLDLHTRAYARPERAVLDVLRFAH